MSKRIIACVITFILFAVFVPVQCAFAKETDVYKLNEKYEYVNLDFWQSFEDEYLYNYICLAIKNNHDARKASWKVEEYRQTVKQTFGNELPSLSVGANYAGVHVPQLDNFTLNKNAFILPVIAGYEPDFLLKNRDKTKSSKKSYEAQQYEEKSIYISLAGDVGAAYINILKLDNLIELQNKKIKNFAELETRARKQLQRGVVNQAVYNNAQKNTQDAENDLQSYLKTREQALTQLAVLIGVSPEIANDLQRSSLSSFGNNIVIPQSIESDVIFARPDVMQAETNLDKAKIDVRVARKEFLPRFNIIGILAFNTFTGGSFFSWESAIASVLAGATQDIFQGGKKIAGLKIYKAKYEQLFETYKQTDLRAFKEVNDSLYIQNRDKQIYESTLLNYRLEKNNYHQSLQRYQRGVISYPDLLRSDSDLIKLEQNLADAKTVSLVDYITLYKAVGGQL